MGLDQTTGETLFEFGHGCPNMLAAPVPNNTGVQEAIWNLDRTLYTTTEQQPWDGQRFWETIQPGLTATPPKVKNKQDALPELYLH